MAGLMLPEVGRSDAYSPMYPTYSDRPSFFGTVEQGNAGAL